MEGLISTFHIDWKLMLAQAINFALVLVLFYFLASKPLAKLIKERSEEINTGLLNAKENADLLTKTKAEYNSVILNAKSEADKLLKSAKKEAAAKKVELIEEAKEEVAKMIESGKKTLEAEKAKIISDAKREIVSLVVKSTEKVVGFKSDSVFNEKVTKELRNL